MNVVRGRPASQHATLGRPLDVAPDWLRNSKHAARNADGAQRGSCCSRHVGPSRHPASRLRFTSSRYVHGTYRAAAAFCPIDSPAGHLKVVGWGHITWLQHGRRGEVRSLHHWHRNAYPAARRETGALGHNRPSVPTSQFAGKRPQCDPSNRGPSCRVSVQIDDALVRRLVPEQFRQWSELPIVPVAPPQPTAVSP